MLTPTYPRPVTLAELERDAIGPNSLLGYYTNFIYLLDYAAVAAPAGFMSNGLPWGVASLAARSRINVCSASPTCLNA
ncbi:hypothetical protein BG57_31520 [Caballeronia grimmiae]|uniref:Uncharacterized protein n=1 Tax=Caballeronia grimmiae TaxID=1071679 RepID=A0A069P3Z3_9BURK|nr:hypothetical protein BG57_31520 [Caballeronia grimmiae]GGD73880.1 hypothetical protein GCM10010985_30380 [Caballeronia grimmiae]